MATVNVDDYDDEDVTEAVFEVTGAIVSRASIDDEHTYWFLLGDWNEKPTDEHDYGENLFDLLNPYPYKNDQSEKILKYLAENFVTLDESWKRTVQEIKT